MKIVDISNDIYIENGSPSTTSIPAIAYWVRSKAGQLNTILFEDFVLNDSLELINADGSEINTQVVSVLKQMYRVYDLELQIRYLTNAVTTDPVLEVQDNFAGTSFKRQNRGELIKTLVSLRKDELAFLDKLIDGYRSLTSQPAQVAGDDTLAGYNQAYPPYYPLMSRRY